jgi:hypothetical protein
LPIYFKKNRLFSKSAVAFAAGFSDKRQQSIILGFFSNPRAIVYKKPKTNLFYRDFF